MSVSPIGPSLPLQRRTFHVSAPAPRASVAVASTAAPALPRVDLQDAWEQAKAWLTRAGHAIFTFATGASFKELQTVETPNDPNDVNWDGGDDLPRAQDGLRADAGKERAALAKLSAADQDAYNAVKQAVGGRPIAARALQQMLLDGRLPGGGLLSNLGALATQPLAAGIQREALLNDTIREVEDPVRVAQHAKGTCGATTAQILLIRQDAAEYVRLVAGLASPAGTVKARGGATLRRHADWNADNDGGRSTSSRLIQPAFMTVGEVGPFGYDNTADTATAGPIHLGGGLLPQGEAGLLRQVTGKGYHSHMAMPWNRQALMDRLARETANGPIPVSLNWGDGGHFVQVDKILDGKVYLTNPWGEQDTMAVDELKAHLTSIITA